MKHNKEMIVLVIGFLFLILISSNSISAAQPTQQYAKIFLNPFYRPAMVANTNYSYNFTLDPHDGVSSVSSAIITFDMYINPTRTFTLWVNGKACNNPDYVVSTTYAGAGKAQVYFDCSNIITKAGTYNVTYRVTGGNIGSSTAWVDITYMTKPKGQLTVHGTEYNNDQTAKVWLQLLDSNGSSIDDGVCYADIYTPDGGYLLEYSNMINMEHDGIYYLDYALTDLPAGVYPAIARCFYEAGQTYNYALGTFVFNGTLNAGTVANTYVIDGTVLRFKEKDIKVPAPERDRVSAGLNFTNGSVCSDIDEGLLTGITFRTVTKFDSVVNDDITLSIYNYTSGLWIDLPNKILEGNAFRDVSNSIALNNITKAGFVNGSGSNLRVKYTDTNLADAGPESNLDIDYATITCDQLTNPEWQEVKGSSEIHVSIPEGVEEYVAESLCGEDSKNGFLSICSEFRNNLSYANFTWGYIYDKVTFYNSYNADIDEIETYATSISQDCTGLLDITETRNGTTYSILENVTLSQGNKDNCILSIPVIFDSSENDFYVEITQENYMKWEVDRKRDLISYYRLPIQSFCNNVETQHGITFQIPITGGNDVSTLYASNPILLGCYRSMDDLYWFDYYYNAGSEINTSGEYESYMYNIDMYYEELKDGADAVSSITGQDVLVHVNTLCGESSSYPNQYSCARIMPPDAYFTSQEGYILQNLTVINDFNTTTNLYYSYSTARGVDCSAVMEIIKDNGTRTDIIDEVLFNSGADGSCDMNIPINNVEGIPSYQIELYIENYLLWDIYWARDNVNGWNDTIVDFCDGIVTEYNEEGQPSGGEGNIATELSGFSTDKTLNYGTPDDLIYGDTGYCQWYTDIVSFPIIINYSSSSADIVSSYKMKATSSGTRMPKNWTLHGQLAGGGWELIDTQTNILWGAYEEKEFTIGTPASYDDYKITIISSEHLTRLQIDDIGFWASNSSNGTFEFIIPINSSIEEYRTNPELYFCYRAIDDLYWWYYFYDELNSSNFTTVGEIGSYHYESEYFWQRILNDYNTVNTYNRNLNQLLILEEILELRDNTAERVWTYTNRTLTDFVFNVSVSINNTAIAEAVWSFSNRSLTYYELSNLTASDIWSYTDRNLTYYQNFTVPQLDLTNYSLIAQTVWDYQNRNLTYYQINNISTEDIWNYVSRNLTYYQNFTVTQEDLTNYTLITENIWSYNNRSLTLYQYNNLTLEDIWNYTNRSLTQDIATQVWLYQDRNLTYYQNFTVAQEDLTNYTLITENIWSYVNRSLTQDLPFEIWTYSSRNLTQDIAFDVWYYSDRNLTYYPSVDLSQIPGDVWEYVSRNLTYYPSQVDLTNYTLINEGVWSYFNRSLTDFNFLINVNMSSLNMTEIAENVWNYGNRSLTFYQVNNISANDIWTYVNRTLTDYNQTAQTDLTDYDKIQIMVWNATDRNLTYYQNFTVPQSDLTNYTKIVEDNWNYNNRSLTYYEVTQVNATDIAIEVWQNNNRTLTYYQLNNITAQDIWEYTNRNLTYYQDITNYTLIQQMVWNATTRSLTELNLTVNVNATAIAEAVWSSVNRTLTDYNQSDLTNYNLIQQVVWNATIRTLTDFNFTVETNTNATATAVWEFTNKTVQFANGSVDTVQDIKDMGHTYVGGTEYLSGDSGKITIRLVRGTGSLAEIELGATCIVSITYPNGTYFVTNGSMTELGNGAYYYDFTVPPVLGIYPYFTDCNISDRFYYSLDDFHVYENNFSTIYPNVWNYSTRNLTYYEVANLTNVTVNVNNSAVAESVWAFNGTINNNILSQIGEYTWTVFNNIHDFITAIWSAPTRTLTTGNCRYLEYGYYNKDLPMLRDINCE